MSVTQMSGSRRTLSDVDQRRRPGRVAKASIWFTKRPTRQPVAAVAPADLQVDSAAEGNRPTWTFDAVRLRHIARLVLTGRRVKLSIACSRCWDSN
jgi:hypothetical protein